MNYGTITIIANVFNRSNIKLSWHIPENDQDYLNWKSYTKNTLPDEIVAWHEGEKINISKSYIKSYKFDEYLENVNIFK